MKAKNSSVLRFGNRVANCEVVQIPLLPDSEAEILAISLDDSVMYDALNELIEQGYEMTLSKNQKNDNVSVALRASYEMTPNSGYVMYSNAPDVKMALAVCVYKHFTVAAGKPWSSISSQKGTLFS